MIAWKQLDLMHRLAVWDRRGAEWMPIFDRDGEVYAYARAYFASQDWIIQNYRELDNADAQTQRATCKEKTCA